MGIRSKARRLIAVISFLVACVQASAAWAGCSVEQTELRGTWGTASFSVEVADTPQERGQGLMHREEMARSAGMLFVYESPGSVSFWMKNTLIPLDMIFADETGTVRAVHSNAVPLDETPIPGGDDIKFVLEINGGLSQVYGITAGSELRHPAVDQNIAAWPCG